MNLVLTFSLLSWEANVLLGFFLISKIGIGTVELFEESLQCCKFSKVLKS